MSLKIIDIFTEVHNLTYQARQAGASFRLLSTILNSDYETVYKALLNGGMHSIGKIGESDFMEMRRGRPTRNEAELITKISETLKSAMAIRKITPKRWAHSYGIGISALIDPWAAELTYDIPVQLFINEDFPEVSTEAVQPYIIEKVKPNNATKYCIAKDGRKYYWVCSSLHERLNVYAKSKQTAETKAYGQHNLFCAINRLQVYIQTGSAEKALNWTGTEDAKRDIKDVLKERRAAAEQSPEPAHKVYPSTPEHQAYLAAKAAQDNQEAERERLEGVIKGIQDQEVQLVAQLNMVIHSDNYLLIEQIEDRIDECRKNIEQAQKQIKQ